MIRPYIINFFLILFFLPSITYSKSDLEKCADKKFIDWNTNLSETTPGHLIVHSYDIKTKEVLYTYHIEIENPFSSIGPKISENKYSTSLPFTNPLVERTLDDIIEERNYLRKTFPVKFSHKNLINPQSNLDSIPHLIFKSEEIHNKFRFELPNNMNEYNEKKNRERKEMSKFVKNNLKEKLNDKSKFYERYFIDCQIEKKQNKKLFENKY